MSDYYDTFVILNDEETYSEVERCVVVRTIVPVNIDAIEENHGSEGVAQALHAFGDALTIEHLLTVYDAAKALCDAPVSEEGAISEAALAAMEALDYAVYPKV